MMPKEHSEDWESDDEIVELTCPLCLTELTRTPSFGPRDGLQPLPTLPPGVARKSPYPVPAPVGATAGPGLRSQLAASTARSAAGATSQFAQLFGA